MEKEKGCVYFFRHVGLEPIKIGFSSDPSPMKRFNQFKTYAPFGAEIIGFIQTHEAKEIETLLHSKYSYKRLDGEWFLISEDECINEINFYTSKEDVKERNDFQIAWAKKILDNNEVKSITKKGETNLEKIEAIYKADSAFNRTKVAEMLGITRLHVQRIIKSIKNK